MNGVDQTEEVIFTDADHLQLLQLQALRAMAQRRNRQEGARALRASSADRQPNSAIPENWRLVPEHFTPYPWQSECLERWRVAGYRGTVKVATGGGKTLFALLAAQTLQNEREKDLRVVVVVPTIPLMFQWYDEVQAGNLPREAIALMGGGFQPQHLRDSRLLIAVLNSARDRLPEMARREHWSDRMLLVLDECHRAAAEQARKVLNCRPRYTLGLSATPEPGLEMSELPPDEAYNKGILGRELGPIIYDFTLQDSLAAGLLTPFEVWHIGLPLTPEEYRRHEKLSREIADLRKDLEVRHRSSRSKQTFIAWCQTIKDRGGPLAGQADRFLGLAAERKRMLYRAEARSRVTLGILREACASRESRVIVFHEVISETERIFRLAKLAGLPVLLEHSELPDSLRNDSIEAFRKGIGRIIVSAKSLIEGFNVPSADVGIIVASSGSVRQRIQSLGRMLRRKPGGRMATIYVLYVRDTEDEAIYEKADWHTIIGAERNRYFEWSFVDESMDWRAGLKESDVPREYRPPCFEVDVSLIQPGDPYPGQTHGLELRVDHQKNVRQMHDGALVKVPADIVERIVTWNPYARAVVVPCGHVVVRDSDGKWLFAGVLKGELSPSETEQNGRSTFLRLVRASGKRRVALERGTELVFPQGPSDVENHLLKWVAEQEAQRQVTVNRIMWNGNRDYFVEIGGERIRCPLDLEPLEF
ncbi:MAG TPA: DEAD/DEAH box helicase [Dehalococcoidia bacterium]|nr:DEAD/DEAH box helicase [Dehalococcoidia bacterium]